MLFKVLATHLKIILACIIEEDQTGFVKGRSSCINIRRLLNVSDMSATGSGWPGSLCRHLRSCQMALSVLHFGEIWFKQ